MEGPTRISKYELLDYLGGGMSRVYRARDTLIGRIVCVKILGEQGTADSEAKARFLQEARVAGNLNHDNVIRVYDFGEDDHGHPFMVMEFIEGDDLRHLMKDGRTGDLQWKLKAALQIARSLEHIHSRRIIHRDIKPENIHVTANGVVKLMDFGIAKSDDVSLTRTGFTLGTPYYMAPEQVRGQAATPEWDVYAYGVMLFELLTGVRPTDGETIETIFYKILYTPLDMAPLATAQVPEPVRELVARCTAKEPVERPHSFTEICRALEAVLGDAAPKIENAAPPLPSIGGDAATLHPPAHLSGGGAPQSGPMRPGAGAAVATPSALPTIQPGLPTPGSMPTLQGVPGAAADAVTPYPPPRAAGGARTKLLVAGVFAAVVVVGGIAIAMLMRSGKTAETTQTQQVVRLQPAITTPSGTMVLVPAGVFLSGKDGVKQELPDFYVDRTEVTNAAYARFCQERGRPLPQGFAQDRPDLPVVNITYVDAQEFARWAGKRLPTMPEWEKAARGTDGRKYPWGPDATPGLSNNGTKALVPADSLAAGASPCGALNMVGNAWEFVYDLRTPTPGALAAFEKLVTPPPAADEPWYAMRGGAFDTPLSPDLTWDSASVPARYRNVNIGFRCVRDP